MSDSVVPSAAVPIHAHPLTAKQERKLVDNLEERYLEITRNFKKRSDQSSTLPTLSSYLHAMQPLLSLVLQIPPVNPSTSLRTSLLLRLTGEVMNSIPGYPPDVETLPELLSWLDILDRGWLAVLRLQAWDPVQHEGIDLASTDARSSPPSQTERTRLRSLLVTGTTRMEDWLEPLGKAGANEYGEELERVHLQEGFDELFFRTLTEMGGFGEVASDPAGMIGTC
ncbi:hypothetical protein BV25DRAFT_1886008 [Artomyces pyxidatus]|uniref:Uncharacterized protein n=1 Tax=Artomyces pyxidatus TaxID=48021 RepID=A0ACB8T012_9AGAM|nr:hypothetical protein BV25DRAFT_1886008 [Artomyces pyxidatus]